MAIAWYIGDFAVQTNMPKIAAFLLTLLLTILVAVPLAVPSTYDYRVLPWRAIPEPAACAFAFVAGVYCISAFTTAMAILLALTKKASGVAWQKKFFLLGIVTGLCIAASLDEWCIHAMRDLHPPPHHKTPGYIFCMICLGLALVGMAIMAILEFRTWQIANLPPGGFNQEELCKLVDRGEISFDEYERCCISVQKAKLRRSLFFRRKQKRINRPRSG